MKTRSSIRRWTPRIVVVLLLLAAGLWARRELWRPEPVEVRCVQVARGSVAATVTNSKAGTVRARRRAHVSPEVGGRVAEILHREGDLVDAGELLFRLDDRRIAAQLAVAENARGAAEARAEERRVAMERAGRALERKRGLAQEQIVSQDLLDELESAWALGKAAHVAALADVERARAEVELARADLDQTRIRAPFSGVVAEMDVELGEWVTPAPPMIQVPAAVDLIDPGSLYVSAPMDEVDVAVIRAGQEVLITVDSHQGRVFPGRVARVAPYVLDVEQQNRTVEIEVDFADLETIEGLVPGTSADVEVVLETRDDVLRLPTQALFEGKFALVLEDGVLHRRQLELGLKNWDWVEVRDGVAEGERTALSLGRKGLADGAPAVEAPTEP